MVCIIVRYRLKTLMCQKQRPTPQGSGVSNREKEMDLSFGDTLTSRLSMTENDQEKEAASQFSAITVQCSDQGQKFNLVILPEEMSVDQTLSE